MGWLGGWLGGVAGGADITPPSAPTLESVSSTTTTAVVSVTVPAADHTLTTVLYGTFGSTAALGSDTTASNADLTFTGLTPGVSYWFVAYAQDASGNFSAPSNVVVVRTIGSSEQVDEWEADIDSVFLNADEFGESVTYTFDDGSTRAVIAVFVELTGALDAVQQGTFYIRNDALLGVENPLRGETITNSQGRWTVVDSKEDVKMHAVKCVLPIERN